MEIPENKAIFAPLPVLPASPNDPPWNSIVALGVWIASVILVVVLPNLILVPYLLAKKAPMTDAESLLKFITSDTTAILLNVGAIIPAHAITLVIAWLVITRYRRFSFRETLGFKSGGLVWWHYVAILVGFFIVAAVVSNYFPEQQNDLLRILQSSRAAVFLIAFMATFTAPVVEEVIYRGILYSALQRSIGVAAAIGVVTLLFALVHVPQYYPSFSTIFLITLLSFVLTLVRASTGNLLPCILLHFFFNGAQSLMLILEPWISQPTAAPEQGLTIVGLLK